MCTDLLPNLALMIFSTILFEKLCFLAIKKGLSLKAGGEGLVDKEGKVISNTEMGILMSLLNKYIEPKDRK